MVGKTNSSGPLGILFTPNVDIDGNLGWTNNGELDNPPEINIKGPKGDPGRSGVDLGAYVTPTATGMIASFDDGADDLPVKSLMVDIDPAQAGSGEPSPTNVRSISGWTGAKLTKTGKNLLPAVVKTTSENGITYDRRADGTVHVYGTTNQGQRSYGYFDVPNSNIKGGCSYVIGGCPANGSKTTYCLGLQWILNGALKFGNWEWGQGLSAPVVIPEGATNVQVFVRVEPDITLDLIFEPTIQLADNSSAVFESYTEDIYNISFPAEAGTVYGGTLDATNGVLTVNKAYYQFNGTETPASMAEFTTVKRATFRLSALGLPDAMAMAGVPNSGKTGLFSHGKYLTAWSGTSADVPHGYADVNNLHTYLPFENATSDSVKAYFSTQAQNGTPVQIVYSLATPITYQLTPTEVKTLLGVNNIWADTGDVSVSYRADPTIIYNKLTAAIISSGGAV